MSTTVRVNGTVQFTFFFIMRLTHYHYRDLWFAYCNTCNLILSWSLKMYRRSTSEIWVCQISCDFFLTFNRRCDYVIPLNFYLSNYCTPYVAYNFSLLLFVQDIVLLYLDNCNVFFEFSFYNIFSFIQYFHLFPISWKSLFPQVLWWACYFFALFLLFASVWCSLILFSIILPFSPIYFLWQ